MLSQLFHRRSSNACRFTTGVLIINKLITWKHGEFMFAD